MTTGKYSYDRTAKVPFESVLHKAAEAEEFMRKAYLSLHSFKFGLDGMEEIPSHLEPLYRQVMTTLDKLHPAQREAGQLAGMVQRVANRR
jgi:hypothetical protein